MSATGPFSNSLEHGISSLNGKYKHDFDPDKPGFEQAVRVRNAFKKYGKDDPVLNDFDMTVERGTIYGLLGASGCGKTTILSCIVGLRKLDSGNISVFGALPGTEESGIPGRTVGYMPQEIGLYQIFTIQEIFEYFGKIYGMPKTEVKSRIKFLISFLDLPESGRLIGSLSGGEARRCSLGVAMLSEPELLILDEPTVGVDPLIRESIWEHLSTIVKNDTTVIITTHYIEETRQCDTIGLMRNGRLLTEKPPMELLKEHNTDLLSDIVLKLCKKDSLFLSSNPSTDSSPQLSDRRPSSNASKPVLGLTYKSRSSEDDIKVGRLRRARRNLERKSTGERLRDDLCSLYNKTEALVKRNILMLLRYPVFLIIVIFIPTFHITLATMVLGRNVNNLSFGVVNHEFPSSLNYLDSICQENLDNCQNGTSSCNFLKLFAQNQVKWVPYLSEEEALKGVETGLTLGYISIPANFSRNLRDRYLHGNFVSNKTMDGSEIGIRMDMASYIRASFLIKGVYEHYLEFVKASVANCGEDPRTVDVAWKIHPVIGSFDETFLEFMLPAQILLAIFITPMTCALYIVMDKRNGTLDRNVVAGIKMVHTFVSYLISQGIVIIISLATFFLVLFFVFDYKIEGSFPLTFLTCFVQGIVGLSISIVIGSIFDHELPALFLIIGIYKPIMVASGSVWPLDGDAPWVRAICELLPATKSVEALRSIFSRGWGLEHANVWEGFVSMFCWIFLSCLVVGIIHRKK